MAKNKFIEAVQAGYKVEGDSLELGAGIFEGEIIAEAKVRIPVKTMNRHGLIAGATGSGKTKTLQVLSEQLSNRGIPVLLMDIKGDLSGVAVKGESNPKIMDRHSKIGIPWQSNYCTAELLTLSNEKGVRLRATVIEFGPILLSKILGLNDTQQGVMAVVFKFSDDNQLPLLDLRDLQKVLTYITDAGKEEFESTYGKTSSATVGTIVRKIVELEQQGADQFFGERSFDVGDLVRKDEFGRGMVSIVRVTDLQDRPKLFSTFMLQLLSEIYATFPEKGDIEKPELVVFIDEAHLVFQEATSTLIQQIETMVKLIRSKGIGIYFVTQNPSDIPSGVLGQLGLRIQHALRAVTAKDRKDIKLAAENFPLTDFYQVEDLLTQLGIGEALVTALNEKGIPTPLVYTMLRAPESRMNILTEEEINNVVALSKIVPKYNEEVDRQSAYEILSGKLLPGSETATQEVVVEEEAGSDMMEKAKDVLGDIFNSPLTKQVGRTVARELTRGLLGSLGLGALGKKRWF
ncbi:MAG: helicase HerA-like domain-containing protein [Saprospiraceae bacterium]